MERHHYADELLRSTAAVSSCMADFLERLEVEATPGRRRHLWYRLRKSGVDLQHWDHSPRRWYSTARLAEAVAASTSYAGVLRHLGVPQAGGSQAYLAQRIRRDGLDTSTSSARATCMAPGATGAHVRRRCSSCAHRGRHGSRRRSCAA